MAPANIVKKNNTFEKMTNRQLKNRLENLLEKLNKENADHTMAVLHPKIQDFEAEEVSSKLERAVTAALKPEKVDDTPHQKKTFCGPRLGRCPHCRKRTDVSKIPEARNRLTCKQKKCGKTTAMKKWLCVNCSRTRSTDIEFDSCLCFARTLVQKGDTVLTCPQTKCNGWRRFDTIDLPDCRREAKTVRTKCDYCNKSSLAKDWFCSSCCKKKKGVTFAECTCFTNLPDYLKAKKQKSKSNDIVLTCPREKCRRRKQFKKKELTQVIMKKLAETRLMCLTCSSRYCIWKWKCFKCKKVSCKCNCEKPEALKASMKAAMHVFQTCTLNTKSSVH